MKTVFYSKLVPPSAAGWAPGPFVIIRPEYKEDAGLLAHELVHVEQFWRRPYTHIPMYLASKAYRLACEVEAYKVQLEYNPRQIHTFARFLATSYMLGITEEDALRHLQA
jgi:hypothetical protein